ncbi:unnamed protein product [Owenia fusiformis]|uniref:Uncharacterized protein n=1 Tax=Owenia fusiformis TaxID=6347 RepID=A0A8S4PJ38_OWEFU|nr:unnamed protein product [Owenia fusiformis]
MAPQMAQTTMAPAPAQTTLAPQMAQTTMAPAPAQTTMAPQMAQTTIAPAPAQTTMAPQMAQTTIAPAPAQTTMIPQMVQTTMAPDLPQTTMTPQMAQTTMAQTAPLSIISANMTKIRVNSQNSMSQLTGDLNDLGILEQSECLPADSPPFHNIIQLQLETVSVTKIFVLINGTSLVCDPWAYKNQHQLQVKIHTTSNTGDESSILGRFRFCEAQFYPDGVPGVCTYICPCDTHHCEYVFLDWFALTDVPDQSICMVEVRSDLQLLQIKV